MLRISRRHLQLINSELFGLRKIKTESEFINLICAQFHLVLLLRMLSLRLLPTLAKENPVAGGKGKKLSGDSFGFYEIPGKNFLLCF